jgi:hypothetical protein
LLVHSAHLVWIVYAVGFVQSTIAQFFRPAEQAVLPTLVSEDLLVTANSLSSLNANMARLVGPSIGGLVAITTGLMGVTFIDAASFLIAAGLVSVLVMPSQPAPEESEDAATASRAVWREWLEGLRLVWRSSNLSVLIGLFALSSVGEGVFGTMFVIWVKQVLHGSALQYGWFMSAQAVGGVVGGLVVGALGSRVLPQRLAWTGILAFAVLDMALFSYPVVRPEVWIGLVIMVVVGIPAEGGGSAMLALLQRTAPDAYRGRIFGALGTTSALAHLIGTLVAGTLGGIVGPIALLNIFQGGSYLLVAGVMFAMSARLAVHPSASTETAISTGG